MHTYIYTVKPLKYRKVDDQYFCWIIHFHRFWVLLPAVGEAGAAAALAGANGDGMDLGFYMSQLARTCTDTKKMEV